MLTLQGPTNATTNCNIRFSFVKDNQKCITFETYYANIRKKIYRNFSKHYTTL